MERAVPEDSGSRSLPVFRLPWHVVQPALLCLLADHFLSALGTGHTDLLKIRLCILAVRETGACKEFSVRAVLDHHLTAAEVTDLIRNLISDLH